jgi:hypothetical protein
MQPGWVVPSESMGVEGAGSGSGLELMEKSETKESIGVRSMWCAGWNVKNCVRIRGLFKLSFYTKYR